MNVVTAFEGSLILLFVLALYHALRNFSVKSVVLSFLLVGIVYIAVEILVMELTYNYYYPHHYQLWIHNFPLSIALAWITVSYMGFLLARRSNILIGALSASSIDALLEPLAYYLGLWIWRLPAPYPTVYYFNAPVGNCLGWVTFTLISTAILTRILSARIEVI